MDMTLPEPPDRWTPEYQRKVNLAIVQAFHRVQEFPRIPKGGLATKALIKASDRDFDVKWTP